MKRNLLTLFLVLVSVALCAWPDAKHISVPNGANLGWDSASATWRPIAVTGDGLMQSNTAISFTVPDANSTTAVSVTATAANVASLANRKSFTVVNTSATETLWVSLDSVTASAAVNVGLPIYPYGFKSDELAPGKIIGLYSATPLTAIVYQNAVTP